MSSTPYQHRSFTLASGDDRKLYATQVRQPAGSYTWAAYLQMAGWVMFAGDADSREAIKATTFDIPALLERMSAKLAAPAQRN